MPCEAGRNFNGECYDPRTHRAQPIRHRLRNFSCPFVSFDPFVENSTAWEQRRWAPSKIDGGLRFQGARLLILAFRREAAVLQRTSAPPIVHARPC